MVKGIKLAIKKSNSPSVTSSVHVCHAYKGSLFWRGSIRIAHSTCSFSFWKKKKKKQKNETTEHKMILQNIKIHILNPYWFKLLRVAKH